MLSTEVRPFFSSEEINQLAKDAGFIQRNSGKLDGATFLNLIIFHKDNLKDQSLNDLCLTAYKDYGIEIKKQSLHERFNEHAVEFLAKVLEQILKKHLQKEQFIESIQGFTRILIKDSTCFQVSENAKDVYPGCGGCASAAGVRIQFEFDILSGSIVSLSLTAYTNQDATNSLQTIEVINAGELVIRDLAYMHPKAIRKIVERMAYFISRLHPQYKVYEIKDHNTLKEIDFEELYNYMKTCQLSMIEKDVVVDKDNPLSLRLIISLMPDQEVAKRISRIRDQQKRKKRNEPSKQYLTRCHFNLFLTNASRKQLPTPTVWELYKFRWMIELVFKTWKSIWGIHAIKKVSIHRLNCYIYTKLLIIVLNWSIIWKLIQQIQLIGNVYISINKCNKFLKIMLSNLKGFFNADKIGILRCIKIICIKINELICERRQKKRTLTETIFNWNNIIIN